MANIATLLARILSTRYGNEMRQDLHDSIEAVNDDTETALGKKLTFTTNTRKLKLLAKDDTVLSEVVISGGSGSGSVDSVNGLFPDENGNVELNLDDIKDVDITSAADGQTLVYDAESHKWVNGAGGGGTTNYTDLTNKPSVNGVTLSGNKTSADLGIFAPTITSPTSGQLIKYDGSKWINGSVSGGSNPNLLDNPHFQINQKGFTSGQCGDYTSITMFDRWNSSYSGGADRNGIITYNSDNSVTLSPNFTTGRHGGIAIGQKIDRKMVDTLSNIDVCISAYLNDYSVKVVKVFNITENMILSQWQELDDNYEIGLYLDTRDANSYVVQLLIERIDTDIVPSASGIKVNYMKVELGSTSTIEKDYLPNYTEELLKCQRYYVPLKSYFSYVYGHSATTQIIRYPLATPMRTTPTLYGSATIEGGYNGSYQTETVATSDITIYNLDNIISMRISTTKSYDLGSCCTIGWNDAYLSAEL